MRSTWLALLALVGTALGAAACGEDRSGNRSGVQASADGLNGNGDPCPGSGLGAPGSWARLPAAGAPKFTGLFGWDGQHLVGWDPQGMAGAVFDICTGLWAPVPVRDGPDAAVLAAPGAVSRDSGAALLLWPSTAGAGATGRFYDPRQNAWTVLDLGVVPAPVRLPGGDRNAPVRPGIDSVLVGATLLAWPTMPGGLPGVGAIAFVFDFTKTQRRPLAGGAWAPASSAGAPSPRAGYTLISRGTRVAVFGGQSPAGVSLFDGAVYDAASDAWTTLAGPDAPPPTLSGYSSISAGDTTLFHGFSGAFGAPDYAGLFSAASLRWTRLEAAGMPAQMSLTSGLVGEQLVVYNPPGAGGVGTPANAAVYDLKTHTWQPASVAGGPPAAGLGDDLALVTQSRLMVMAFNSSQLYSYDTGANAWSVRAFADGPGPRASPVLVTTDRRAVVWGGSAPGSPALAGPYLNDGAVLTLP